MTYGEMVGKIAQSDKTEFERGEALIRQFCKLTDEMLDYKYMIEHYNGGERSSVIEDEKNILANKLAAVKSDLDIYIMKLGITSEVVNKATKRLERMIKRIK